MRQNRRRISTRTTINHEGQKAFRPTNANLLRRSVMSCLLWEDTFYEDGEDIARRIRRLVPDVNPVDCCRIAIKARQEMNLRHVPLLIARVMCAHDIHSVFVSELLPKIILRPDEITEFLAIYSKGRRGTKKLNKLSNQAKKGLAKAFTKFDEYQLAKYNRATEISLKDAMFLCHPKPLDDEQAELWDRLVNDKLAVPDTWEVELSASSDKQASWTRLLKENRLGVMALLRNLRNMMQADVDDNLIRQALNSARPNRVLPFRFISAAEHAPRFEPELEALMLRCLESQEKISGRTALLVDMSGSMFMHHISRNSTMYRGDAANALAIVAREIFNDIDIYSFSINLIEIAPRRGFALADAIKSSQEHNATNLRRTMIEINRMNKYDRIIILTDEQSSDGAPPDPLADRAYVVNVNSYENSINFGSYIQINGWSTAVIDYIRGFENYEI